MDKPLKPAHDHEPLIFPQGFLWGAGNSAFQCEGNNTLSDWWAWEQTHQPVEKRSGEASDHYNRFKEDFEMAKQLGQNASRVGVEWARIEPTPGEYNVEAIEHYREVVRTLKSKGMKVMVTLHHFSNPAWFADRGGWASHNAPNLYARYVERIVPELAEYVDLWITINEPSIYCFLGYWTKEFPPQKHSAWMLFRCYRHMVSAHKKAYRIIHRLVPKAQVGAAHSVVSINALHHHSFLEGIVQYFSDLVTNHAFMLLTGKKYHDFIGLNYYMNQYISFNGESRIPSVLDIDKTRKDVSDLGWEIYPQGIFEMIADFSDYHLPIYITENGIATTNDDRRVRFLLSYLQEVYHAIQLGIDVRGYFYWCLIDNMELHRGFDPRFGLIGVDFKTQKRTPKPSAYVYKDITENNSIRHELMKLMGHGINVEEVIKEYTKA